MIQYVKHSRYRGYAAEGHQKPRRECECKEAEIGKMMIPVCVHHHHHRAAKARNSTFLSVYI